MSEHNNKEDTQSTGQRIDRWLWHARIFKSRTLAATHVTDGKVRVNQKRIKKSSATVKVGDVITVPKGAWVQILEVLALSNRRGPAAEAQLLYSDRTPPRPSAKKDQEPSGPVRHKGFNRLDRRTRRQRITDNPLKN